MAGSAGVYSGATFHCDGTPEGHECVVPTARLVYAGPEHPDKGAQA